MKLQESFPQTFSSFLLHYELGSLREYKRLRQGYANLNYLIRTTRGEYLFRNFIQQGIHEVFFELEVLERLRKIGFPTAYPIPARDGRLWCQAGNGMVVIYNYIRGRQPRVSLMAAREIARVLALLHTRVSTEGLAKKNAVHIDECLSLIDRFPQSACSYPEMFRFFEEETRILEPHLRIRLPEGLVHGDAWPDNTLFSKGRLMALLDFEESCIDHLLFDLGMGLNGFCFRHNRPEPRLIGVFLNTYTKYRELRPEETQLLSWYVRWGAQGMILWHLKHLVNRPYPRQLKRVLELTDRIQYLRKKPVSC